MKLLWFVSFLSIVISYHHDHEYLNFNIENKLWDQVDNAQSFITLAPTLITLRSYLRAKDYFTHRELEIDQQKFKAGVDKSIRLLNQNMSLAKILTSQKQYSSATIIYSDILTYGSQLLDPKSLRSIQSLLGNSYFREALIGSQSWQTIVDYYLHLSSSNSLLPDETFQFDMAIKNQVYFNNSNNSTAGIVNEEKLAYEVLN